MSRKRIQRRIPFQVAAHRLKNRLDASTGEIALWVAGFVSGTTLTAFTSELDDAAQFNFQSGIYANDPNSLDYGKKLSDCYFDASAVETIVPSERYVDMQTAVERLQRVANDIPDPVGLIKNLIKHDRLQCAHPIVGVPRLDDEAEFFGALINARDLGRAIADHFSHGLDRLPSAAPTRDCRQQPDAASAPRVAWRRVLYERIDEIDRQAGGKARLRAVIRWLRQHGGRRILKEGEPDELLWIDDNNTRQRAKKSTVSNAISLARKWAKPPA